MLSIHGCVSPVDRAILRAEREQRIRWLGELGHKVVIMRKDFLAVGKQDTMIHVKYPFVWFSRTCRAQPLSFSFVERGNKEYQPSTGAFHCHPFLFPCQAFR